MRSFPEWQLLARSPLKLPGGFRVRPTAPLKTVSGWKGEWRFCGRPNSHHALVNQTFISLG